MPDDNFDLRTDDFWSDPLRMSEDEPIPPPGLFLAAPDQVSLETRTTLPMVVRRSTSLKDAAVAPFDRLGLVHLVDVDRSRVYSGFALDQDNAVYEQIASDELARMATATTLEPFLIEGRARTELPWKPAELLVVVTVRDQVSNRRRVTLGAGPSRFEDPAVQEFLESKRGQLPPDDPFPPPGQPYPAYGPMDGSPELPRKAGIAIAGDRVTVLDGESSCIVRGAFLLPVRKQDLVPAKARGPSAVLQIGLVLTGADDPTPIPISLRVPVYGPAEAGALAPGFFTFDLLSLVTLPKKAQTYFLYAFSRDVMAGPSPFAFVTRAMLPPGAR